MIPLISYLRTGISAEQKETRFKWAWGLSLLMLFVWGWWYNKCTYGSTRKTWWEDDPMMLSGFVAVLIGISYSVLSDRSQVKLVRRLHDAAIVDLNETRWSEIRVLLKRYALIWRIFILSGLMALMILGYYFFYIEGSTIKREIIEEVIKYKWEFALASLICTILAGLRLGRIIANSFTGHAIRKVSPSFEMVIQHPDGAGGLDSIGRFYLWQAGVLLIPTIWLLLWIGIAPYMPGYGHWSSHFWRLLLFGAVLWMLAVAVPMYSFHRLIVTWKAEHLEPAVANIRFIFRNLRGKHLRGRCQRRQIQELSNYLHSLTSLPDWPISTRTLVSFFTTVALPISVALLGALISGIIAPRLG